MLAPIPPSGWSSWNAFHCTLNETLVLRQAALLVSTGLRDAGFNSIHLDDCVYAPSRDNTTGRLLPAHTFPSGFAALSAQLGAINISLGMYSDMGFRTCQGLPGLLDFEEADAATFSAWGVRFLKNDGCFTGSPRYKGWPGAGIPQPGAYEKAQRMFAALNGTIVHNIQVGTAPHLARSVSNMRRCGGDIGDSFGSVMGSMAGCFNGGGAPLSDVGPGFWNDGDSLEVGNGGQTLSEYTAHFAAWCVAKFPLILGFNLEAPRCRDCAAGGAEVLSLLLNRELVAINADPLGVPAAPRGWARVAGDADAAASVWAGPLAGAAYALLLLNTSPGNATSASVDLAAVLGVAAGTPLSCRDVLARRDCGSVTAGAANLSTPLPSHSAAVFVLRRVGAAALPSGAPRHLPAVHLGGEWAAAARPPRPPLAAAPPRAAPSLQPPLQQPPAPWLQRGGDAAHSGRAGAAGPSSCALRWSFHVGADGGGVQGMECAPVVSSTGVVVAPLNVGGAGSLFGLNLSTGAQLWAVPLNGSVWATPVIVAAAGGGELAVVGSQFGGALAVHVASGAVAWRALGGFYSALFSSFSTLDPADPASTLWVGSWDNHLYELDRATGAVVSSLDLGTEVRSSPALAAAPGGGVRAYLSVGTALLCVERPGAGGAPSLQWALRTPGFAYSSATLSAEGSRVFFPNSGDATARCLDARTGALVWAAWLGGDDSAQGALSGDGRSFFVVARGGAVALDAATGAVVWRGRGGGNSALTLDAAGALWFVTNQGGLLALRGGDGGVGLECDGAVGQWGTSGAVVLPGSGLALATDGRGALFAVGGPAAPAAAARGPTALPPTQIVVSLKPVPALSVPATPQFSWAVPPSPTAPDAAQASYRIVVAPALGGGGAATWDSGVVPSNNSVGVPYGGPPLPTGSPFTLTLTVTLTDGTSATAPPALFTTAPAWAPAAAWVWSAGKDTFAYFRREVAPPPAPPALALLHATAFTDEVTLTGYKVWVNGAIVGVGPGRGEARVWGGDGVFRSLPYDTYDVTALVAAGGAPIVLAVAGRGAVDGEGGARGVLLQLQLFAADGSAATVYTGDGGGWLAWGADGYVHPTAGGGTFYKKALEFIDARVEPVGWRGGGFNASGWAPPVAVQNASSAAAAAGLTAKMARPVEAPRDVPPVPLQPLNASFAYADFGREFQGGLRLAVGDGVAGAVVRLTTGEELLDGVVGQTWGYSFEWTLRGGAQLIEQHEYMEFRYVNVEVVGGGGVPLSVLALSLSAWAVQAPWDPAASSFSSSNATLDAVFELARYTLQAGILDTFTDSNTRERRPYEADGLVAATARMLLQGDAAWARHSYSYVFSFPTWPVEWVQISVLLAWADYWLTGDAVLAAAFLPRLSNNTRYPLDADGSGLLNCNAQLPKGCTGCCNTGDHIVDWDPSPSGAMFKMSTHTSVNNFFALQGLRLLSALAAAAGQGGEAARLAAAAAALNATVFNQMWDENSTAFCDGACEEVGGRSGVTTAAWALFTGALPPRGVAPAWARLQQWGLEGFGDYGAFIFLQALNAHPEGDGGEAVLEALTKCDKDSWCAEIRDFNATMTRESWGSGTYSHPWGTAAVVGVVGGVMGVQQTAPAWGAFTVQPRLGGLAHAALKIATPRGPIEVTANATHTALRGPCGAAATLCVAHGGRAPGAARVRLDGVEVLGAAWRPRHACVERVGCGAAGAPRVLAVEA